MFRKRGLRFGIVELSLGMIVKTGKDFGELKEEVESTTPSRWDNPVLIVIPRGFEGTHEEEETRRLPGGDVDNWVVAVPMSGGGYGAGYFGLVNSNRKRFGLPGTFVPSKKMLDMLEFREGITSFSDFIRKRPLLGDPEEPEDVKESETLISKLSDIKRSKDEERAKGGE